MSFDLVAFVMGKDGVSRNVLSALMAGDGGGVPGSLEECGWVSTKAGKTTITKNEIVFPKNDISGYFSICPPVINKFISGDSLVIAIKVTEVHHRMYISLDNTQNITAQSTTGLFSLLSSAWGSVITGSDVSGEDVLSFNYGGDSNFMRFNPVPLNSTSRNTYSYGTIEITGMKFNGTVIYGKV